MSHTPGPWLVNDGRVIYASNGTRICELAGAASNPTIAADARLIAAGPDLLKAAQEAVNAMGEQHGGSMFEGKCNECHAHLALVAAIAKATEPA